MLFFRHPVLSEQVSITDPGAMAPKRTVHTNARVENIKTMRAAAQQQLRELRSDLKKAL